MKLLYLKLRAFLGSFFLEASSNKKQARVRHLDPISDSQMYFAEDENVLHDIQYKVMSGNRVMDMHTGEIIESFSKRNAAHYALDQELLRKQARVTLNPEEAGLKWKVRDEKLKNNT